MKVSASTIYWSLLSHNTHPRTGRGGGHDKGLKFFNGISREAIFFFWKIVLKNEKEIMDELNMQ